LELLILSLGVVITALFTCQFSRHKYTCFQNRTRGSAYIPDHYAVIIENINHIENIYDLDSVVFLIKKTFSDIGELGHKDFAYLLLIINHLKLKYYQLSDDVYIVTTIVQRIYEHIIYEKSKSN